MSIRKMFFLVSALFISSCSSDLFLVHNGNIPSADRIAEIREGQTKQEIMNILGSPSLVTGLSDDHWIYMASTVKKVAFLSPEEIDRQILALSFSDGAVSKIEKLTLADGNNISIDKETTETAERRQGFFRKYFGGVGAYMPFGGTNDKGI